jgi:hypothetical protein
MTTGILDELQPECGVATSVERLSLEPISCCAGVGCVQRAVSLKRAWRCSINLTVHYDDGRRSKKELDARVRFTPLGSY